VAARRVDDGSGRGGVFRVECPDRPGLLHDLARALSGMGWDLLMVRVATLGPRAADAFHVVRGGRVPTAEEGRVLVAALEAAAAVPEGRGLAM
jgi:UTP:GlnB (protein PII) uridylyltransferase